MKRGNKIYRILSILLLGIISISTSVVFSQTSTSQDKETKRKNELKVFVGAGFSQLNVSKDEFKSTMAPGYMLGASFKQGQFFYWEAGLRFNNSIFKLEDLLNPAIAGQEVSTKFSVTNIDIPLTVGINLLSATRRVLGARIFVSAVPSFNVGVGDNDLEISGDDINSFNFYGQGGVGVDFTFLFVEAGYNYGFSNLLKDDIKSNPSQIFVTFGFRF